MTIEKSDINIAALQENLQDLQDLVITQASKLINSTLYTKSLLSSLPVALISTDRNGVIQVANKAAEDMIQMDLNALRGKSLTEIFTDSPDIVERINKAQEQKEHVSEDSLDMILGPGKRKIVNIHVRPFYDEERNVFGTLLALEDQTYINFLRESFQQHAPAPPDEDVIAQSPKMKKVVKQIQGLAENDSPVLFSGPSGAGKTFLAAKLHKLKSPDQQTPFIMLDCRDIDKTQFKKLLLGSGESVTDDQGHIRFKSLEDYGTVHLAEGGTLVLRNIEALDGEQFKAVNEYLTDLEKERTVLPYCRIVATTKADVSELEKREDIPKPLLTYLTTNQVQVPPLQKRRKDIIPLANLFLASQETEVKKEFSKGAENGLLSKQYTQNNVKELKDAIELASLICEGNLIESEHIFTGPLEQAHDYEFDLTELKPVKFLVSDKTLIALQGLVLSFFLVIIGATLFFPAQLPGIVGNALVWGPWWVLLVVCFLLLGRVWCTICPLSTAGRLMNRIVRLDKSPPAIIKDRSAFIIPIGFVLIIWLEHSFHMISSPRPTGFLLIGLILFAAIFAITYERETWCRYLCPLGNFGSIFSLGAVLFVRSNPNVCATKCTTHNCNKGSDEYAGCPVFHHPLFARNSHICKLCFNCIKSCPHGSARFYLRPPLVRIWQQVDIAETITFFSFVLFFLAPVVLGSEKLPTLTGIGGFTIAVLISIALAFLCQFRLPTILFGEDEQKELRTTRFGLILLLLAWGPFAAFQFGHIPGLDTLYITTGSDSLLTDIIGKSGIPMLTVVQLSSVWFGATLAAITLFALSWSKSAEDSRVFGKITLIFCLVTLFYPILSSWIVL